MDTNHDSSLRGLASSWVESAAFANQVCLAHFEDRLRQDKKACLLSNRRITSRDQS